MKFVMCLFAMVLGLVLNAAEPFTVIKSEKFGRAYIELTDCGGLKYKIYLPIIGNVKCVTATGWYLLNSDGKIVEFQDSKR